MFVCANASDLALNCIDEKWIIWSLTYKKFNYSIFTVGLRTWLHSYNFWLHSLINFFPLGMLEIHEKDPVVSEVTNVDYFRD